MNHARKAVSEATNRADYKKIAKTSRAMSKIDGGKALANQLAQGFVAKYPRRTAMEDEFKKFLD